ncbi:MAG: M48 family metalloprotease [Candidatus Lokiarchaeota archaeon]|nr:M48 family metalloprotease [Candidatus Lokiarchaeota archaeon]
MGETEAIRTIKGKIYLTILISVTVTFFTAFGITALVSYFTGYFNWLLVLIIASIYAAIQIVLQLLLGPSAIESHFGNKLNFISGGSGGANKKVWNMVEKMSKEGNVKFAKIGILETSELNAFVYWGLGYGNAIVFTKGIIEKLDDEELSGVCGHEIGHVKHGDMKAMIFLSTLPIFLHTFYSYSQSQGKYKKDTVIWLLIFIIFLGALIASQYLSLYLSRLREYHADSNATDMKESPVPIAAALAKITYGNIGKGEAMLATRKEVNMLCIVDPHSVARQTNNIAETVNSISEIADHISDPDIDQGELEEEMKKEKKRGGEMERTHPLTVNRITFVVDYAKEIGVI